MMPITSQSCDTPFGSVELSIVEAHGQRLALLHDELAPQAAIYAAKALGIERIVEIVSAAPIDRLLTAPSQIVPHDALDLALGRAATFFVGKGYGFLSQQYVFCPELRGAATQAVEADGMRSFTRGTLAVVDDLAETFDPRWGGHIKARSGVPAAYLAKELELCYAPLCVTGEVTDREALINRLLAALPRQRACPCATAMEATRERGLIGDNWRDWL